MKRAISAVILILCIVLSSCGGGNAQILNPPVSSGPQSEPAAPTPPPAPAQAPEPVPMQEPPQPELEPEPIKTAKHKTGRFSDITVDEYVKQIKIGFNYMSNEFNFSLDNWVDAGEITSIPLVVMASGTVDDIWLHSAQTVLYKGDDKHVNMRLYLEQADSLAEKNEVSITIHIKKDIEFELTPIKLEISDAKVTMKDGTVYLLNDLNGIHELSYTPEENGYVLGTGVEVNLSKEQLTSTFLDADIKVLDAPAAQVKSVYMAEMSDNYITDLRYFDTMKEAGFNAVRLNIDWYYHIDNETFTVDEDYLQSIERIVAYCTDLDLHVLITVHNDYTTYTSIKPYVGDHNESAWMLDVYKPYVDARFNAIWTQIAQWFKDYDEFVTFQPFNEPGMVDYSEYGDDNPFNSWEEFRDISIRRVNEMNQLFIDAVRSTGGNNEKRFLFFEKFDAVFPQEPLESVVVPDDDRIILSLHCYPGYNQDNNFAPAQQWGAEERSYADRLLQWVADFKTQTGIPVVIDEMATTTDSPHDVRIESAKYFIGKAKDLGVPCYWWESMNAGSPVSSHALGYDLLSNTWQYPDLLEVIMDAI
jgi:aryl-phospho-beta-D-glucosidase BglC (GH1 family)